MKRGRIMARGQNEKCHGCKKLADATLMKGQSYLHLARCFLQKKKKCKNVNQTTQICKLVPYYVIKYSLPRAYLSGHFFLASPVAGMGTLKDPGHLGMVWTVDA